jgi:hypothetical protein
MWYYIMKTLRETRQFSACHRYLYLVIEPQLISADAPLAAAKGSNEGTTENPRLFVDMFTILLHQRRH